MGWTRRADSALSRLELWSDSPQGEAQLLAEAGVAQENYRSEIVLEQGERVIGVRSVRVHEKPSLHRHLEFLLCRVQMRELV